MKNQCFGIAQLARCFTPTDFYFDKNLENDDYRSNLIQKAIGISNSNFDNSISLQNIRVSGKIGYKVDCLAEKLILRRCIQNLKNLTKCFQYSRTKIVRELSTILEEASPYRIYRLDIKSFFETVKYSSIEQVLRNIDGISMHTRILIQNFLKQFNRKYTSGLPRGVEISSILADLVLSAFDYSIRTKDGVYYYARYVDDILIITSSLEDENDFLDFIIKNLPRGLILNANKQRVIKIPKHDKSKNSVGNNDKLGAFSFLGYEYTIHSDLNYDSQGFRKVSLNIAKYKLKEFKTKIIKSFYSYSKNKDFSLLKDRLIFLTTNRDLRERKKKKIIPTGIYYNYTYLEVDSSGLVELDNFLSMVIESPKIRIGKLIQPLLTSKQKRRLHKIRFTLGFKNRVYKKYSLDHLSKIVQIWK